MQTVPRRRAAATLLALAAAVVAPLVSTSPALADDGSIFSRSDLFAAVAAAPSGATSPTVLSLDAQFAEPDAAYDVLSTPAGSDITLDLHAYDLRLRQLVVGAGARLTVIDDDNPGTLTAGHPWDNGASGIVVGSGATLHIRGATVDATGSAGAAGIGSASGSSAPAGRLIVSGGAHVGAIGGSGGAGVGGGDHAAAISVVVENSDLMGQGGPGGAGVGSGRDGLSAGGLEVRTSPDMPHGRGDLHSSVEAMGLDGATGVGGGLHASGGTVTVTGTNASVDATARDSALRRDAFSGAVGAGEDGPDTAQGFGSLEIGPGARFQIGSYSSLDIPAGATVHNRGLIDGWGSITGDGTLANDGSVAPFLGYGQLGTDPNSRITVARVTGNNFLTHIDAGRGSIPGTTTYRLFTDRMALSAVPEPGDLDERTGFLGWNTTADGTGRSADDVSMRQLAGRASTDGSAVPLQLFARYGRTASLPGSAAFEARVGQPFDDRVQATGDAIESYSTSHGGDATDSGLPPGIAIDARTGRLTGTPTSAGTYEFDLTARDRRHAATAATVVRVVDPPATSTAPPSASAAPPSAPAAIAAPSLRPAPRALALIGHRIDLRTAVSSARPVRFTLRGTLPKGLRFDESDGSITGTPTASGTFVLTLVATSDAGAGTSDVTITVPPLKELIAARPATPTTSGASTVPVHLAGLRRGERWTVRLDGRPVATGTAKTSGRVDATVRIPASKHDRAHVVTIAGSRKIADPAQTATTRFTITALAPAKRLHATATRDGGTAVVTVDRLAPGERVAVKEGRTVFAEGVTDAEGRFTSTPLRLGSKTRHLVITGATAGRNASVAIQTSKR